MKKQNERKSRAKNNFANNIGGNEQKGRNTESSNKMNHNMTNTRNDFAQNEADKNRFGY